MRVAWKILEKLFLTGVNKTKYSLGLPFAVRTLNFPITYACNSRCTMCSIWKIYKEDRALFDKELTVPEWIRFFEINRPALAKLNNIGLTGGEPTLKPGLHELVAFLREHYPETRIGIQTNGLFPAHQLKVLKRLLDIYPDLGVAVSLDGMGQTHDTVRGVDGAFDSALETIRGARELGAKEITCGLTLSQHNLDQVLDVARLCGELECEFSCFPPETSGYFSNQEQAGEIRALRQAMAQAMEPFRYHYFMDNARLQLLGKRTRRLACYSGQTSFVLDPYGNLRPCLVRPEKFGNVRDRPLEDIFSDPATKALQKKLKKCKQCFLQCEVGNSVLMDFTDLFVWFLFHCSDRRTFLRTYLTKYNKPFYKSM